MEKIVSCCGVVCTDCEYYPEECKGCPAIEGKAFWLQFTGEDICPIYACCVQQNMLFHCGLCTNFPCALYTSGEGDPTKTAEENEAILKKQIEQLRNMP